MKVQSVCSTYYNFYNSKNISFGERFDDEKLKSNHYSDFIEQSRSKISQLILGEDLAKPMKFDGVGKDFNVHFDMYGAGKLHLLLMPNKDGINNFARYYHERKKSTLKSIERVMEIMKKTHPNHDLYLFESGASERLKQVNRNGVVPAHLHFVANKKDSSATIERIHSYLRDVVGGNVVKFKSLSVDSLFEIVSELSQNGEFEYKFIAKRVGKDRFDTSLYHCNKGDKLFKLKSQVPSRVLSRIFYNADNPSYYNWKNIDADPRNWSALTRKKITKDRIENGKFVKQIKSLGLLLETKAKIQLVKLDFTIIKTILFKLGSKLPT